MTQGQFDKLDYQPRAVHDHLHLRLLAIDALTLGPTWAAQGVRSPFWRIYVNNRPGAFVEVDGRRHPLSPNHVHLLPAWVRFDCWNETQLEHFFIHFDAVGWPPAVVRELFATAIALPGSPVTESLVGAITQALHAGRHDAPDTLALAKALAYCSLSRIVPPTSFEANAVMLEGPNPVSPAIRYIEAHLNAEIDNSTLASLCHLSRSHFIRTFHKTVGQTPAQYIRERRVARAAEELVLTHAKIDEIAQRCGFPNRFYFSRAFTQVMGVPPAKYRSMVI